MKFYDIYQTVLASVAIYSIIAIGLAVLLFGVSRIMLPIVRWIKAHKVDALLVAPFVLCMVWTGSTKTEISTRARKPPCRKNCVRISVPNS